MVNGPYLFGYFCLCRKQVEQTRTWPFETWYTFAGMHASLQAMLFIFSTCNLFYQLSSCVFERPHSHLDRTRLPKNQIFWVSDGVRSACKDIIILHAFHHHLSSSFLIPSLSPPLFRKQDPDWKLNTPVVWCQKESWIFLMVLTLSVLGGWDSCTRWTAKRDFWIRLFGTFVVEGKLDYLRT